MPKLLSLLAGTTLALSVSTAQAEDFSIAFEWGDLELCTTGNPNTVSNPTFQLSGVPDGTKWIYFKMVDKDVPNYNHGGGWVKYEGQSEVAPGAFTYKSPCPPNGSHTYEWRAEAKKQKASYSGAIGKAKAAKLYP